MGHGVLDPIGFSWLEWGQRQAVLFDLGARRFYILGRVLYLQTVYTEIFFWLEKKTEGDRSARMRRDAGPWTGDKVLRKVSKHLLWLAVALWTGCRD